MSKLFLGEKKKTSIRAAGLRTEKKFFGKRGIFAKAGQTKHLKNPSELDQAFERLRISDDELDKLRGKMTWHKAYSILKAAGMADQVDRKTGLLKNPGEREDWSREIEYIQAERWKPLGKKNVLAFSRQSGSLFQILQKEAREWRVLYRTFLTAGASPAESLGTFKNLDLALIAANRQANDWVRANPVKNKSRWEPPQPWKDVAESPYTRDKFILAGDGNVYARTLSGWVNHGTLKEFTDHALKYWKPLRWSKNPGAAWHEGMADAAGRYGRGAKEPLEKALAKGMEVAHRDSAGAARRLHMNRPKRRNRITPERRTRKNPLAVFGFANPPEKVSSSVAGVIYNICHEVRAEKTGYKRGLYRHPFSKKSGVQVLALDNGDLLLHSTAGERLWKRS